MLGKGAYGGVYLVKKKNTNDFFAMKVIDFSGKVSKISLRKKIEKKNVLINFIYFWEKKSLIRSIWRHFSRRRMYLKLSQEIGLSKL